MTVLEIEVFGRGGLTHYVYNLARELGARGVDTVIATAADYELEREAQRLPSNVRIEKTFSLLANRLRGRLPYRVLRSMKGVEFFGDVIRTVRLARRLRPDVIHVHCTNAIVVWLMAALRPLRIPVVYTAHDVTPHERIPFERATMARIHALADHLVVHSDEDRRRLAAEFGEGGDRVSVIPHGDYGFFDRDAVRPGREAARAALGLDPDAEVALFFGFIREYKGLDLLLDAWGKVADARPGARLVVAGDPARLTAARLQELRAQADSLGVLHRFAYIPFDEVAGYFVAADVLVLPYRKISQSGVLLLALSMGVPVVATRVGAFPEVITDGETGMLVEPGDRDALSATLTRALGDAPLRARLAEAGRRRVEETYSWTTIAGHTQALFDALTGAPAERAPVGTGETS